MSFIGNKPADKLLDAGDIAQGIFAETSIPQTFTAPQRSSILIDNDLSFNLSASNNFKCTPSTIGTITFTNLVAGQSGYIYLDNTTGYAISKSASVIVNTTLLALISNSGKYLISYFCDGINVILTTSGALS